jgi:hypothetical protein
MEIASIQVVVSVVLILAAAGVALLCDFLKRKNDNLRQAMADLELQFQREEEMPVGVSHTRTVSVATPPPLPAPAPAAAEQAPVEEAILVATAVEEPVAAANGRSHGRMNGRGNGRDRDFGENLVRKSNSATRTKTPVFAQDRSNEWTSVSGRRPSPPMHVSEAHPKMDEMNSQEALSEWLNRRRTAARIAETIASQASKPETQMTATPAPVSTPVPTPVSSIEPTPKPDDLAETVVVETTVAPEPVILPEPIAAEQPLASQGSVSQHAVEIDSFLWESLISGTPAGPSPVAAGIAPTPTVANTQFELIQGSAPTWNQLVIPAGMFDQSFLARLLEIKKPFTGLAVSIGINENDGSAPRSEDLMRSTSIFISSLLQDGDFGCQSGDDEFLMLCPGPKGAEAQRRLSQIAERLWDFQLRGIGTFSILFSWGGIEVNNELISDAIASAAERMYQTKRSRKTVSMESVNQRRKAV